MVRDAIRAVYIVIYVVRARGVTSRVEPTPLPVMSIKMFIDFDQASWVFSHLLTPRVLRFNFLLERESHHVHVKPRLFTAFLFFTSARLLYSSLNLGLVPPSSVGSFRWNVPTLHICARGRSQCQKVRVSGSGEIFIVYKTIEEGGEA